MALSPTLTIAFIAVFLAGCAFSYLIVKVRHEADMRREQAQQLASQAERLLALEKIITAQRQRRGKLYEENLEDLQAKYARVGRLLKLALRDMVDVAQQTSPGILREVLDELEVIQLG